MSERARVTSADFIRSVGFWQNEALRHPVVITHHGRERLILAAPENFSEASTANANAESGFIALKTTHETVLDNLEEGLLVFDALLNITVANRVALAFCGRDAERTFGAPLVEVMPQPLASVLHDRAQRVLRARKSEAFETSTFDSRQLSLRVFPIGAGVGVLFHNTTEVSALRRRLEEDDALAAALKRHSRAATIKLDARARIESIGASFCTLSGFASVDLTGHRFVDLVSPHQRHETGELIERVLRERTSGEMALVLLDRRGGEHPGRLAAAPILTDLIAHGVMAVWTPASEGESTSAAA